MTVHLRQVLAPTAEQLAEAGQARASATYAAFVAMADAHSEAMLGSDDFAQQPDSALRSFARQQYSRKIVVVAIDGPGPEGSEISSDPDAAAPTLEALPTTPALADDEDTACDAPGTVVGYLTVGMPTRDNTHMADVSVGVAPQRGGEGIGRALADLGEAIVASDGRRTITAWMDHHPVSADEAARPGADVLVPATGVGRVPRDRPARFALARGYVLQQAERHSVLELAEATAQVDGWFEGAQGAAGSDYRVLEWTGITPEERRDDLAELLRRMSVDIPSGDLDVEEEDWDAQRVVDGETTAAEGGNLLLTVAIEHAPSGTLVAYSRAFLPSHLPAVAFQGDTFVHGEHRGRRLGMLAKAAMLRTLRDHHANVERIHTWNAGENEYMLAINEAIGFRERLTEGAWEKRLGA